MEEVQNTVKKEDIRIVKSKRDLRNALMALMKEVPYSNISVIDICDYAMINRMTFYKHFKDKNELFCECVKEQAKLIFTRAHAQVAPIKEKGCGLADIIKKYIEIIVSVVEEKREIVCALIKGNEDVALNILSENIRGYVVQSIDFITRKNTLLVSKDFAVSLLEGAFVGVLTDWIKDPDCKPKEKLISEYFFVIDKVVSCPEGIIFKK